MQTPEDTTVPAQEENKPEATENEATDAEQTDDYSADAEQTDSDGKNMKSPETGNGFSSSLWLAILLSCGGAIMAVGAYGKKKKHSR